MQVPSREMSVDGMARLAALQRWIAADRAEGVFSLDGALRKWRDDVVTRLIARRPLRIRIPELFQTALGLRGPKVVITEDGSVYTYTGRKGSDFRLERLIVPKKS